MGFWDAKKVSLVQENASVGFLTALENAMIDARLPMTIVSRRGELATPPLQQDVKTQLQLLYNVTLLAQCC